MTTSCLATDSHLAENVPDQGWSYISMKEGGRPPVQHGPQHSCWWVK